MDKREFTEGMEFLRVLRKICLNPPKCHKIACNSAAIAISDFHNARKSKVKQNLPNILRLSPSIAHKINVLNGREICEIHHYVSVTSAASSVLSPTVQLT